MKVDERRRSVSNPRVWAGGDAVTRRDGRLPLTPIAGRDGFAIAAALLGEVRDPVAYAAVPSVVYTEPPLAAIGLSEREARAQGLDFTGELVDTSSWQTNRRAGEEHAAAKVLVERRTGRILGAHVLGPSAVELVNVLAVAMQHGLPAEGLRRTVFAYPTGASDLAYLL
jgi:glutathione reductase (NADPH)